MTLNEQVKRYAELKKQADAAKKEMDQLKVTIVEAMGSNNVFEADNGVVAKLITKETFKYTDEQAMIKWLENNGYDSFVVKKVNTTPMNNELKKGMSLTESLSTMYRKETSVSLEVK